MKTMKKLFALIMALAMVMALAVTVSASSDEPAAPTKGTITLKNATKGYEYKAYKILDATYKTTTGEDGTSTTSVSYTTKNPTLFGAEGSPWVVGKIADAAGNYNVQLAEGKKVEDVNTWITTNLSKFTAIAPTEGADANGKAEAATLKWTGLDFGYYYITSGLGAITTINSTTPDVEVYDKNTTEPEDPAKQIVSVDGAEASGLTADAHVGSVIGFKVTAKTNNWIDKDTIRNEWTLTDTPTNMTIVESSIVVKFNNTELTKDTDYTVTFDGKKMTINVPMVKNGNSIFAANTLDTANEVFGLIPIEITYKATIDAAAADAPAKNEIPGDNPPPPVEVDTYMFQLNKIDGNGDALLGAEFQLYKVDKDGTETLVKFIKNEDGSYTYSPDGTVDKISLTEAASAVIKGLDKNWDYVLKEVTVPKGYNQADDLDIAGTSLTKAEEKATPNPVNVTNNAGAELPSTGGIGTTIFTVVGAALMIGAAVLFITKKRSVME